MSTVQTTGGIGDGKIVFRNRADGSQYSLFYDSTTKELSIKKNNNQVFSTDGVTAEFHTNVSIQPGFSYLGGKNMGQIGYQAAVPVVYNTYGTITISAADTWTPFSLFTAPPSVAVRVSTEVIPGTSGQRFIVDDAGIYMVYTYVACRVEGNSEDYLAWGFSINGAAATPCEIVMREINNNTLMNTYPMCMGFLPAGASVELQVKNITQNNNVRVAAARFQVIRF